MTHIYKNIYLFTNQKTIRKLLADGFEYRFPLISHTREFLVLQCSEEFFTASKSGKKLLSEDGRIITYEGGCLIKLNLKYICNNHS